MNIGELSQGQVLSDDDGAEYRGRGWQFLSGLDIEDPGAVRYENICVRAVAGRGEVPGHGAGAGQDQRQAAAVVGWSFVIRAVSTVARWAETSFTCNIQEHILRWLVQADNVNLLILRVVNRPTTARSFPDRLVERGEIRRVKGRVAATVQTSGETIAV